ncbi:helix-turn-helix domain-containing protein [Paraclostridium sordellii]|uniref:helix-turn-helix domain-containing protein n=1 Tax=Paraclostridium sordellii TaxID=1505 RepID=UPI0005E79FE2|nr:helix-turn-helix domain-containing protein [Paeniclostridium sordellii]CEN21279.1 putative transcriptional regulator [[Clostridium] sordellii] [Paeniclostridium sordellii]
MSINDNIKKLREEYLDLSQQEFADKIDIKRNSVSLLETGRRNPSDRTISDICAVFNVNIDWLKTGEGPIFNEIPTSDHFAYLASEIGSSDNEILKQSFYKICKLNEKNLKIAEKLIDVLLEEQ